MQSLFEIYILEILRWKNVVDKPQNIIFARTHYKIQ